MTDCGHAQGWSGLDAEGLIRRCRQALLDRALEGVFSGTVVPNDQPEHHWLAVEERGYGFEVRHTRKAGGQPERRRQRAPNDSCGIAFKDVPSESVGALRERFHDGFRSAGFEIYRTITPADESSQGVHVFEDWEDDIVIRGAVFTFPGEPGHLVLAELNARTQALMDRNGVGITC